MSKLSIVLLTILLVTSSCNRYAKDVEQEGNFPLEQSLSVKINESIRKLAISDGWAVVQTPGKLSAIDLATTDNLWTLDNFSADEDSEFSIKHDLFSAASYDRVLVSNKGGKNKAVDLDASTGNIIRLLATYDNYLYIVRGPNWELEAYDISQNELLWKVLVGRGQTDVFYDPQTMIAYVVTPNSIKAYDNSNGKLLWEQQVKIIHNDYDGGILYLCEQSDKPGTFRFTALDTKNGKKLWKKEYSLGANTEIYQLSIIQNKLIATSRYYYLAIDRNNGDQLWKSESAGDIFYNEPVEYNAILYARGSSGKLYAISSGDGYIIGTIIPGENPASQSRYEASQKVYRLNNGIAVTNDKDIVVFGLK